MIDNFSKLNLTMLLVSCFVLLFYPIYNLAIEEEPEYDEVAKFNELLQLENPLAVLFTEECCKCADCVEAEVLLGGMSQELENLGILVIRLKKQDLRSRYGIKKVPSLVYIRKNKTACFDSTFEMDTLQSFLQDNIEPVTVDLDDNSFEHLTQAATGATTGDWLVLFHDGSCCKKRELISLETAGVLLKNTVNVANVDTSRSPETAERFKLKKCPSVIFFRHQKLYRFTLMDINIGALVRFAKGFYVNSKAEKVPLPPSAFDKFLDLVIEYSRGIYNEHAYTMFVILSLTTFGTSCLLVCVLFLPSRARPKKE